MESSVKQEKAMLNLELNEQQQMIRDMIRDFAVKEVEPIAAEIDESMEFPEANIDKLAQLGILGMTVPEEYGGMGLDHLSYTIVVEELSRVCASTGITVAAAISLGIGPILANGSAALETIAVQSGDRVLAARGEVAELASRFPLYPDILAAARA